MIKADWFKNDEVPLTSGRIFRCFVFQLKIRVAFETQTFNIMYVDGFYFFIPEGTSVKQ